MTDKVLVHDNTLGVDLKMWEIDAEEALRRDQAGRYSVTAEIRRVLPAKNPGGRGH